MLTQTEAQQDRATILDYLTEITRGWDQLTEPAMLELRCLFPPTRHPDMSRFSPDATGFEMLADHALAMNKTGLNCYVVVNPIKASAPLHRGDKKSGARDEDIIASFFYWADGDDEEAANSIRNFAGPKWTMAVTTGLVPTPRPHIYWRIADGPTYDLQAWTGVQKAIAARLSTDRTVVNPSRIMRLPGTINWPTVKKQQKGRIAETATLRTRYDDGRQPVAIEQMVRAFGSGPPAPTTGSGFQIDTGAYQTLDRERATIQALEGVEWHHAVIRLVASYVGKGLSDGEIHALTDPLTLSGYTIDQTRAEVQTAIDGARRKGWTPETDNQFREMSHDEKESIPALMFEPWQEKDLSTIPVPEFVYSDFYARKYTSITLAAPKVGKSMLALAEALDMATGRGFLTGVQRDPLVVVYYNAEDDQDVMDARVSALLTRYNIPQSEIVGRFYPVSGVTADDFYMMSGDVPVINEPLFIGLEKFCETAKADVLIFDPLQDLSRSGETNEAFRLLGQRVRRMANKVGVALGLVHHTRKVAAGLKPSIDDMRGGGALRGTARFNRILISMTEEEAVKAGVENHRHFMRIGDMESNLAPPSSEVNQWYQKISVLTPNGHHVGAIEKWVWPDAFDGLSKMDAARVRNAIMAMPEPPLESIRSPNRWAGLVVADTLGLDIGDKGQKARVASLIKGWVASGVLAVDTAQNPRAGREVNVIIAGPNNPMSEESA